MQQTLENFYKAVRAAGVAVAPANSIEASRAVALVGYRERGILKHALSMNLAKSHADQLLVEECFEQFFRFDAFKDRARDAATQGGDDPMANTAANAEAAGKQKATAEPRYEGELPLAKMLMTRDRTALAVAMQQAARDAGLTDIWFFTQKSLYTQQILQRMGLRELQDEIRALGEGSCPTRIATAGALRTAKDWLYEEVRDFVERQLGMFGKTAVQSLRERHLQKTRLSNIDLRDFRIMHELVRKMARRLSSLYSRKRKRADRGQLDFARTLRRNVAHDGVLFETHWKTRFIDRPRVLVLCDVSGSVQAYARFLLLFLHSLNDVLKRIDSYVFTGGLVSVNDIFDSYPVADAIDRIMAEHGFGGSDYGGMLLDLERECLRGIDHRTTVLI
ncbi:MAG: VWA domain-containing protein, partial [Porticoccaceae bacterium]